ncbi:MAG: phenylalanine--tRNA ligase subunit alpha [bacterium]|nr:phenylalanine--tRNA ligase subunit alpha [bacterium]
MDSENIITSLHPLERRVLPALAKASTPEAIVKASGLQEIEVMRALQWLQNKKIVSIDEKAAEFVSLDVNGKKYLKEGLPEKRFLEALKKKGYTLDELKKATSMERDELNVCIGTLRKKAAIDVSKTDGILRLSISDNGKKLLQKESLEEKFLKQKFPIAIESLSPEDKFAFDELRKRRRIIVVSTQKARSIKLLALGQNILKKGIGNATVIDSLTNSMLKSGSWKGKKFRRYDVKADVPRLFGGRKQSYREFLEEVREKFLSLGFIEKTGPIVETEFWNMDTLFMPQFHSARDIHDAYYIKEPKYSSDLPKALVAKVKQAHENGFETGSKGWRYNFDTKRTSRNVLRTQDTSISPRTLSSKELQIPGKYFQMVRCFRYDVIDATHLPDFNQVGGFVVEKGLTFRHLVSLLKLFAKEFAETDKVKVVPAYFPFTEPSAALYAKHPEMGWIELAGSGMFRPEMCKPLGVSDPVIAWGVGVERLAMFKLGLKDIRQLFSHDLEFLRNVRVI